MSYAARSFGPDCANSNEALTALLAESLGLGDVHHLQQLYLFISLPYRGLYLFLSKWGEMKGPEGL